MGAPWISIDARGVRRASLGLFTLAALGPGCGGPPTDPGPDRSTFPESFLFGTAIAGFQVDMGCPTVPASDCEDPGSDWYVYVTDPGLIGTTSLHISGDPPSKGPGFFELYEQDLDRTKNELKNNALRLSFEWSRIFPTSTVGITGFDALHAAASAPALTYYHALLAAMKARGLTPLVTVDHYTLPTWIHDPVACHADISSCAPAGWLDPSLIEDEIAKYAGFVGQEFGGEVDRWATLNEPVTAVALAGYFIPGESRSQPPGVSLQAAATKTAINTMIEAHAKMYDALHVADTVDADGDGTAVQVGIVYNLEATAPADASRPNDLDSAANMDYLINRAFLTAITAGKLDANLDGTTVDRPDLASRLDYLGINYYARLVAEWDNSPFPDLSVLFTVNVLTLQMDYDYPKGLYEVAMDARQYGVPLIITETGVDDGNDDGAGVRWLTDTVEWARRAWADGAPIEGYFYWSLMDNYEWNHGMNVHMGLYGVSGDDPTKARTARQSVATYGRIATARNVPSDLLEQYPLE